MNLLVGMMKRFLEYSPGNGEDVRVIFAPGRVNLIGEHVDYAGGHVFPAALDLGVYVFVRPRTDSVCRFLSTTFAGEVTRRLDDFAFRKEDDFANYPKGVIQQLLHRGIPFQGGDFFFHSDLPSGAGLSSSAAIEVGVALAVLTIAKTTMLRADVALLAQKAENEYVGVQCGIMDQFAVALGKRHHAVAIHCQTLAYEHVPADFGEFRLVIANTNKPHALGDSKYNERRAECEAALDVARQVLPSLQSLTDVTRNLWPRVEAAIADVVVAKRARHIVSENLRVLDAVQALNRGNYVKFGALMNMSHASLSEDYEVTGHELDTLAAAGQAVNGCSGSRMTGGGFGGCTVSLVHLDAIETFKQQVSATYEAEIGYLPTFYETDIGDGVHECTAEVSNR